MTNPSFFNQALVWPITNALVAIFHLLSLLHFSNALGFSIIILTACIRIILYPLTSSQLKMSKKIQEINPHLVKLKHKHKNDAKMLQQETMKLYKEHGVNPAAGCLPALIQLPIVWGLYSVLRQVVGINQNQLVAEINKIVYFRGLRLHSPWSQYFFGAPIGQSPSHLGVLILVVPIATALFQLIQSKMLFSSPVASAPPDKSSKIVVKKKPGAKSDPQDFASAFQSQSLYIFPAMIGLMSYSFPIGLSLYWNTFTIFGIIQQYHIIGIGGLSEWRNKLNGKKEGQQQNNK